MQIVVKVFTVRVDQSCDTCNIGRMRPTGVAMMSNPPKFPHECTHCGAKQNFNTRYPCIEYRDEK